MSILQKYILLIVSVQRVLFSVLVFSDIFWLWYLSFPYDKRRKKEKEKENTSCWGERWKNPLFKQHKKLLMILDSSTRNRCHENVVPQGRRQEEFWESKLDNEKVVIIQLC